MRYKDERNYGLVCEGLKLVGRGELIGRGGKCLIKE